MADTVAQLVSDVLDEGGFDATSAQVLRWLNRRWGLMVTRGRAYRKTVTVATTVANQRDYTLPAGTIEVYEVTVAGIPYGNGRHVELAQGARGYVVLGDPEAGIVAGHEDASGNRKLALYPTPTTAGLTILAYAAFRPPDLTQDVPGDSLLAAVLDGDFGDELVDGAIATGLMRLERRHDLAAPHEARFNAACEELRRRVNRRHRGVGPAQVRVVGVNG